MIQFVYQILRTYAPILTLPVAIVVGTVGYIVENSVSKVETPSFESIEEKRRRRQLERGSILISPEPVRDPSKIVPRTLDINLPPSLSQTDK